MNFVGFDIVEVAPVYDQAEISSLLRANLGHEFISGLALKRKNELNSGE